MKAFVPQQHQSPKRASSSLARPASAAAPPLSAPALLRLQRAMGNQAVLRMCSQAASATRGGPAQALSLATLSAGSDPATRQISEPGRAAELPAPAVESPTIESMGQPLPPATRALMESRFGHDFSGVRVHANAEAAMSAAALGARAYTVGQHIVWGESRESLEHSAGRYLLAHELAHVVQQRGGSGRPAPSDSAAAPHEREAQAAAVAVATGGPAHIRCATGVGLACDKTKEAALPELTSADPKASPRYIDTLFQSVSYQWLNGASIFKWQENGKEKTVGVPLKDLVQDDSLTFVALWKVHESKAEALKTVELYTKAAPGFAYYSFYVGPENVIMPTAFSIDSTPQFHALWPGLKQQIAQDAADIRKGLQSLANVINVIPGTQVDEYGNLGFSGNPLDWVPLLKLRRLSKIKDAGPINIKRHSGYGVPYTVKGPHGKLKGTSVYVLKDADGTILYVGKGEALNRLREHIKDPKKTQWFGEIAEIEIKATGLNNTQALALEQDLIAQMKPLHNVDKTPFRSEFGDTMAVGPNLPKPQKPFTFWIEWGKE